MIKCLLEMIVDGVTTKGCLPSNLKLKNIFDRINFYFSCPLSYLKTLFKALLKTIVSIDIIFNVT